MLAGIGLWSCNNDDFEQTGNPLAGNSGEPVDMTFSATMGDKSLSKSTVSATTGETKFSSDDNIKIFTLDGKAAKFACAGVSDNGQEAQFSGTTTKSNGYYAMLPYQESATISGNTMSLTIPSDQRSTYEELMVGYTTKDDQAFQFKHVGAMLRFITHKKFSSIEIEDTKGNKIAGDVTVKISSDGKITEVAGGTSTKVSVTRDISTADSVLITIKPGTYEAGELKIKFADTRDNQPFYHTIDKQVTLKSGVIYSYGNVGRYLITCKDPSTEATLFTLYAADYESASGTISSKAVLPQPPLTAEAGFLYGYSTTANGTIKYTNSIANIKAHTTIYPVKVKGVNLTIYGNGANSAPTMEKVMFQNSSFTLPAITMQTQPGNTCGYSYSANGTPTMQAGSNISIGKSDLTIYAVETKAYTVNVYGNGSSQAPTFTKSGIEGFSFTLPTLPEKSGFFAAYSTKDNDSEIKYYQNQSMTYDTYIFGKTVYETNFYPVYRELVPVTTTKDASLSGKQVGEGYTQTTYMTSPLPQVEKGTCTVFKFKNHCNASAAANNNVTIVLLDKDDLTTTNAKILRLDQKSYGQAEFYLTSNDFMANINEAEVTVRVYNKGGVADVEVSWTGTNDNKKNSVMYRNISIWDNLYVTFGVKNSYIELL